ncbi:MAG: ABC transporter ATP-binding protein [Phycisphaeraceae bacterium]|nr:MAG: ABC transporter ATP-binding protein [Phycisphaeraceae bacterium]
MIEAEGITKSFGRVEAVRDVSFTQPAGSAVALWGSNGAGKTTLIRCLLGVMRCRGSARIGGVDVRSRGRQARALVGYVPQELAFHDDVRLGSAILFFGGLRRVDGARVSASLASVGLAGHERKRVRDLSGGMKQRLALAIALLADPPLIVLDEPTSNLDAAGRGEVVQTLRMLKDAGKTLLFASHRPDEVITLADRVLVLERGAVERDTTAAELWPTEKPVQVIRLHLSMASEAHAARVLREAGHAVHLNGQGLCVAVPRDQKAAPIHTLACSQIQVRDIEMLDDVDIPEGTP